MDFNLSEQQKMLQRVATEFAIRSVEPRATEIDSSGQFPFDLAQEMGKRGYQGLPSSETRDWISNMNLR